MASRRSSKPEPGSMLGKGTSVLELSPITDAASDCEGRTSTLLYSPSQQATSCTSREWTPASDSQLEGCHFDMVLRSTCRASVKVESLRCSRPDSAGSASSSSCDGPEQQYEELQLTVRIPRPHRQPDGGPADAAPELAALKSQVAQKEQDCHRAAQALKRKNHECDNLTDIVRELTDSRGKLVSGKAIQAERHEDLQREYHRVMRIADLSRSLSKENLAKAAEAHRQLSSAQEELVRHKQLISYLREQCARTQLDNLQLSQRVCLLERLPALGSACMVEFVGAGSKESY